ncbi:histidine phosphatase family protein [Ruminococcus sp.]|uniref:histidine phosphatase family protein n=1 Tax=Ruminococcus sp. TaxID=41978 RepID=UPI0025F7EBE0|nr:histidine phosphatase family protein [Ruminococcus sp.]MBQ8965013.1 histidine phosphatase family protein [Ruminococcus sp.]
MRLLIIRHGESEADILHVHEGRADFELTEKGHRQAEAAAEYIAKNYAPDRIYHSTLKRAAQTAAHIAEKTGAPLRAEEKLMEFGNGLLAGLGYDEAREKYPPVKAAPHEAFYEQETALGFRYRAEFMLSKILSENPPDSTIAVVTHGGMINQLYRAFLRIPHDGDYGFRSGDCCIHEWLAEDNKRQIIRANFVPEIYG